jgi:hypothetical protein
MPVITLNRNENAVITPAVKKPGVLILGKNRNFIRSELEKGETAFRVKFVTKISEMDEISELIMISNDDYAESLKYAFLAEERGIPHLLVTASLNGKCSMRFLHIMYTDEDSEIYAVRAITDTPETLRKNLFTAGESYFVHSFGEGADTNERVAAVFANVLCHLPNYDFEKITITLRTSEDLTENETLRMVQTRIRPEILMLPNEKSDMITADVVCF